MAGIEDIQVGETRRAKSPDLPPIISAKTTADEILEILDKHPDFLAKIQEYVLLRIDGEEAYAWFQEHPAVMIRLVAPWVSGRSQGPPRPGFEWQCRGYSCPGSRRGCGTLEGTRCGFMTQRQMISNRW